MINKFLGFICLLFFSINSNAFTLTLVSTASCPSNNISHIIGQPWKIPSDWQVVEDAPNSPFTQLPADTVLIRTVEPYNFTFTYNLADITCSYQLDNVSQLIIKRTYVEDDEKYPMVNFIYGEAEGFGTFWNDVTSCPTKASTPEKCSWGFYKQTLGGGKQGRC